MILVDANLLIYAVDRDSPQHAPARRWLEAVLSGSEPVGIAWVVALAFVRITTHPRIAASVRQLGFGRVAQARPTLDAIVAVPNGA